MVRAGSKHSQNKRIQSRVKKTGKARKQGTWKTRQGKCLVMSAMQNNNSLLSGNMSEYKASCYALQRAVRATKLRYRERIESHFQLNDSRLMWQGLRTICTVGNKSSAEVRADPLLADELNTFYGCFESNRGCATLPISASESGSQCSDNHVITVSEDEVRRALKLVNVRKAAGPDGITGRVLRSCSDQLAGLFTSIFNESLATSVIPTSFKKSVIIPVPKNYKPSCLNDYRPVALTSIVMKVFERLVKNYICSSIPDTLDPLQFAYRPNRSTDDAISHILHSSLTHIDSKNGNYVRLLFIDYSSAFNTIVPSKLASKLIDLGLNSLLCDWILNFLTGRPQVVKVGQFTSNSITLNVGAPQGCVLSPLLYSLYTLKKIQGLTSNPENFLFRDHRKCIDSVFFSVVWKQLQSRLQSPAESCALS